MGGIVTYVVVFTVTAIWILGWVGLSAVVGMFFDLPFKTSCLIGATLGPLGFLLTLMVGILERHQETDPPMVSSPVFGVSSTTSVEWDPFS